MLRSSRAPAGRGLLAPADFILAYLRVGASESAGGFDLLLRNGLC